MSRGNFDSTYAVPKAQRPQHTKDHLRLMDCLLDVCGEDDAAFLQPPTGEEFVVVDRLTRARAFFECPKGLTPERITAMVDSHFFASSIRVASRIWVA